MHMCIYKHLTFSIKKEFELLGFRKLEEIIQQLILNKIFDFNRKVVYEEVLFNFDLQRLEIETGLKLF